MSIVIAGIDEAGYGPILGPLVAAASAFRIHSVSDPPDLWKLLRRSVAKKATSKKTRLVVADSKKVFSQNKGVGQLERTVLAFMHQLAGMPASIRDLFLASKYRFEEIAGECPWYHDVDVALPMAGNPREIATMANALSANMADKGVEMPAFRCLPLPETRFNSLIAQTRNKAAVLLCQTFSLLSGLMEEFGREGLITYVDKQGGRGFYRRCLQTSFPQAALRIVSESARESVYELRGEFGQVEIHFTTKADGKYFPTALASMKAKYVRELHMALFNRWWQQRIPGLVRTDGYYRSGKRFIAAVLPKIREMGISEDLMVRRR
jgi:ribonuclease HII